jgi:hypothetical protein
VQGAIAPYSIKFVKDISNIHVEVEGEACVQAGEEHQEATHGLDALNQPVERGDKEGMAAIAMNGYSVYLVDRDQYLLAFSAGMAA